MPNVTRQASILLPLSHSLPLISLADKVSFLVNILHSPECFWVFATSGVKTQEDMGDVISKMTMSDFRYILFPFW
ncbi:MAG TPA: hypothetical protein ENJ87_08520 [Gammaproteobacteria bacterium]|nr:hypothetical protein [Gammaproteobacteria bacterium]